MRKLPCVEFFYEFVEYYFMNFSHEITAVRPRNARKPQRDGFSLWLQENLKTNRLHNSTEICCRQRRVDITMPLLMYLDEADLSEFVASLTEDLSPVQADMVTSYLLCENHKRSIKGFCESWNLKRSGFDRIQAEVLAALKKAVATRGIRGWKDLPILEREMRKAATVT
jgi:hypothetical protein